MLHADLAEERCEIGRGVLNGEPLAAIGLAVPADVRDDEEVSLVGIPIVLGSPHGVIGAQPVHQYEWPIARIPIDGVRQFDILVRERSHHGTETLSDPVKSLRTSSEGVVKTSPTAHESVPIRECDRYL